MTTADPDEGQQHRRAFVDTHARTFGAVATDYDRFRPSYPPEAVDLVFAGRPAVVLDLGAGTGKLSAPRRWHACARCSTRCPKWPDPR